MLWILEISKKQKIKTKNHHWKSQRIIVVLIGLLGLFQVLVSFKKKDATPNVLVREQLKHQLAQFETFISDTMSPLVDDDVPETQLQQAFLRARKYYKTVEWAAEYFTYTTAKTMNGAPNSEIDIANQSITSPNGLQVIETYLFPHYTISKKQGVKNEIAFLKENIIVLQTYFSNIDIADWQILDAVKLEVFRIESLGITGFDNGFALYSMGESATALKSVQAVLDYYILKDNSLNVICFAAINYLNKDTDFVAFDRAYFIRQYANPLSSGIEILRRKLGKNTLLYNRLLRQDVFTLFDTAAFDPMAYAPSADQDHIAEKIALGKQLFQDPAFSGTQTRSCASCHIESQAFASDVVKEKTILGNGLADRNTPTLINTALQPQQFYDQRSQNVEEQILDVVHNPKEMDGSIRQALQRIQANKNYKLLVQNAYPNKKILIAKDIVSALASYVRSLVRLNSRFDDYMRGNDRAMTDEEIKGFNLFMGKAQCATCHYMPLFSGVFPPKYMSQDVEILGVPEKINNIVLDNDRGIYSILSKQGLYDSSLMTNFDHAFKTVGIRNAHKTAPYMHNGVFTTLKEVVEFYNEGGGVGRGVSVPNQTLSSDKLKLTPAEIKAIVAFIAALDSR